MGNPEFTHYFVLENVFLRGIIFLLSVIIITKYVELGIAIMFTMGHYLSFIRIGETTLEITLSFAVFLGIIYYLIFIRKTLVNFYFAKDNFPLLIFILFFLWITLTYFLNRTENNVDGMKVIKLSLMNIFVPCIGLFSFKGDKKRIRRFINFYISGAFITAVLIYVIFFYAGFSIDELFTVSFRHFLFFWLSAIALSVPIACSVFFLLHKILTSGRETNILLKFFYSALILFMLFMVFFLATRSSIIGLLIGILLYLAYNKTIRLKVKLMFMGMGIVIFIAGLIISPTLERFKTIGEEESIIDRYRLERWNEAINSFTESPIWGIGTGEYGRVLVGINKDGTICYYKDNAHNLSLQILAEQGITGFILFYLFFGSGILYAVRMKRLSIIGKNWDFLNTYPVLFGLFFMVFFRNQFNGVIYDAADFFWIVALSWVIYQSAKIKFQEGKVYAKTL